MISFKFSLYGSMNIYDTYGIYSILENTVHIFIEVKVMGLARVQLIVVLDG